jgi:hypothetical protein
MYQKTAEVIPACRSQSQYLAFFYCYLAFSRLYKTFTIILLSPDNRNRNPKSFPWDAALS